MLEIGAESDANARPAASVRALRAAVEAFVPDLAGSLDQLVADLAEVARLRDRLSLALSRYVGELDAREAAEALGSISTTDWVRHNCRMSGSAASDLLAVGDQLASLPRAEAAVVAGSVGFGHLVHLARTRRHAASHPWGRSLFDEEQLLGQAMEQSVSRFGFTCVHVRHAADAAGMAAEFEEGRQHRRLSIRRAAGGYVLFDGALDAEGGAALRTALAPLARRRGEGDDRTFEQRTADALVEIAARALDSGDLPGSGGRQRPHLQVSVTVESLAGLPGCTAAEMEWTNPVPFETARRIACDCTAHRVLLGPGGEVVDVGRATRVIPPATRRALVARDRHCRWPGCQRPGGWCEGHHLRFWMNGGRTDLENLVLLCGYHHRLVHEGGWKLAREDPERYVAIPPFLGPRPCARDPRRPSVRAG